MNFKFKKYPFNKYLSLTKSNYKRKKNKNRYSFLIRHLGLVFLHINYESHSSWCRKAW
jgi:hypothetical protein